MNSHVANEIELSTLDLVCSVMDSSMRPLDFVLVFHLKQAPGIEALRIGASSARNRYPTTGSYIDGKQYRRLPMPSDDITILEASPDATITSRIEDFLDRPFDPREQAPVQQLVITNNTDGRVKLITRFHHAAVDGLSAVMWLRHQLRVASGQESFIAEASAFNPVSLQTHPSPVKQSRFAYRGPSHPLSNSWSRSCGQPSRTRHWHTIKIAAANLRKRIRKAGGFTYNDLLITCALEVFIGWNRMHGAGHKRKVSVWLPVNIRQHFFSGFGNGTSRIRIYARYADTASLLDKCREVRRQISWGREHGEWAVPQEVPLARLPLWLIVKPLRCYLNRPWVDMATGVFSHAERWSESEDEIFQHLEQIECIGQLHRRHSVAINGATHHGQTWLTFTYDPGLLTSDDVRLMAEMYQEQLDVAERELR